MGKKIYLPPYAKSQLETSDDSSVWARPIPFSEEPQPGFTSETILNKCTLELGEDYVLEAGRYHPDRDQDLEATIECIEKVPLPKIIPVRAKITHLNAIYRIFQANDGDAECWARYDEGAIDIISRHAYHYAGLLTGPSRFNLIQEKSLDRVLAEGAGIIINRKVMPLCDGSYDSDKGFPKNDPRFAYTDADQESVDGKTYKLFQDYDQGARGWAIFTVKPRSKINVVYEDHNDNIRDWMLSPRFIIKLGLDLNLKYLWREDQDFYDKPYRPTEEDFKQDFHVDADGNRYQLDPDGNRTQA